MSHEWLQIVVSKIASSPEDVDLYARCTLLAASLQPEPLHPSPLPRPSSGARGGQSAPDGGEKMDAVQRCIKHLQEHEFINLRSESLPGGCSLWLLYLVVLDGSFNS